MPSEIAEDIYIVEATKDGDIEFWHEGRGYRVLGGGLTLSRGLAHYGCGHRPWLEVRRHTECLTVERAVELGLPLSPLRRIGPKL
jgi:hypothetical protein